MDSDDSDSSVSRNSSGRFKDDKNEVYAEKRGGEEETFKRLKCVFTVTLYNPERRKVYIRTIRKMYSKIVAQGNYRHNGEVRERGGEEEDYY